MNIQTKERVVGAIVLVALAVIFIPLLLPGKGDIAEPFRQAEAPPAPEHRFAPVPETPEPPALGTAAIAPLAIPADEAVPEPATSGSARVETQVSSVKPAPQTAEPIISTSVKPAAKGPVQGWIVQVGSFSDQAKAAALRDRLRKQGYASFVEAVKSGTTSAYRVRVGPELTREAAERLKQKLQQNLQLDGLVQQYP